MEVHTVHPLPAHNSYFYRIASFSLFHALTSISLFTAGSLQKQNIAKAFTNAAVGGCPLFPADNIWNRDITTLPVHRNSANFIASIGPTGHIHADFGAGLYGGGPIGIPYIHVPCLPPS